MEERKKEKRKIRRNLYYFNIRKTISITKRFTKVEEKITPQLIINYFKNLFFGYVKKEEKAKVEAKITAARTPVNLIVLAVVLVFLSVIFIPIILLFMQAPAPSVEVKEKLPPPEIRYGIGDGGTLNSFDGYRFYLPVEINGTFDKARIIFSTYLDKIPEEVFVLRYTMLHASNYENFYNNLKKYLRERGIAVSEITESELRKIPKRSNIILIVVTGYLPEFFIRDFDLRNFVSDGNVVIYIGYPFTDGVLKRDSPVSVPVSVEEIREKFGIEFQNIEETSRLGFKSFYKVVPRGEKKVIGGGGEYSVNYGNGYLYILATSLDSYFSYSGNKTSEQIGSAIINAYWNVGYSAVEKEVENGTYIIFTSKLDARKFEPREKVYGRIQIIGEKGEGEEKSEVRIVRSIDLAGAKRSSSYHSEEYIPVILSGKTLDVTYTLNEGDGLTYLYINIVNSSGISIFRKLISPEPLPRTISKATYRFSENIPSGDYIVRIESDEGIYSQSYLHVPKFEARLIYPNWDLGSFKFEIYKEGEKYDGDLKNIKISFDGKEEKTVDAIRGELDYNISIYPIQPGPHSFGITIGGDEINLKVDYVRAPGMFEKPENIALALIGVIFFAIAFFVKPTEIIYYNVDVPDFPPLKALAVPMKKEEVVELMERINKDFKWKWVPLNVKDVKLGFAKLTYKGRPILVSDYNVEKIMDKLIDEGLVKSCLGYYGLTKWEKESGNSIYKLTVQRILRDRLVIEGIPFTPFGENPNYDTCLTYMGEKIFIHIYEDMSVIQKALITSAEGRSIIVFENEEKMKEFVSNLHSDSEINIIFKMSLDDPNGNIDVAPLKEVINVIKKKYTFFYY
ncbi:MAG: hypothetical protein QXI58_03215 [Candidatus Micrarchaeia archaeon]